MILTISTVVALLMAPKKEEIGRNFVGILPDHLARHHINLDLKFVMIMSAFTLFAILFLELEVFLLTNGWVKTNVSKHDFVYGAAKLSFDMIFSSVIIMVLIVTLATLLGCGDGDDSGCDADCCCSCDPHTMNMCMLNGHIHCDCFCGYNTRTDHVKYENYKKHLEI